MDYIYTILFIIIIIFSLIEIFIVSNSKIYYFITLILILTCGLRYNVGPDYNSYKNIFFLIKNCTNKINIELLFYYTNLVYKHYNNGYIYVFFSIALLSILLKSITIYTYSYFPILSILFYYTTCYFSGDSGQIRQNLSIAICFFSTRYILKKQFFYFFLFLILAYLFHKTAIMYIFALPLAKVTLQHIPIFIIISLLFFILINIISYNSIISYLSSIIPCKLDVIQQYFIYFNSIKYGQPIHFTYGDVSRFFIIIFCLCINSKTLKKHKHINIFFIYYIFSVFVYFFFRSNEIFATRLILYYKIYEIILVPNMIYTYTFNNKYKIIILCIFLLYIILLYIRIWQKNISMPINFFAHYQNYLFK
jgi:hypothetical protein